MKQRQRLEQIPDEVVAWVVRLHQLTDELTAPIAKSHGERLQCRSGCASCCVDELTVFEIEAAVLARRHARLLREDAPHAEGACAFLDAEGRCRVYEDRPYVCRTQGLPLRWLERDEDDAPVEARDVCALNLDDEGTPLCDLPADRCWTIGPLELRLAERQSAVDDGELRRVTLRSLFAVAPAASPTAGADGRRRLPVV